MSFSHDNRILCNGVNISDEFRHISVTKLRQICAKCAHARHRGLNNRMILYNVILGLEGKYQQEIINTVRFEIAQGKQKYSRKFTKKVSTTNALNPPVDHVSVHKEYFLDCHTHMIT